MTPRELALLAFAHRLSAYADLAFPVFTAMAITFLCCWMIIPALVAVITRSPV